MKKITLLALLLLSIAAQAQTTFEASRNYAKLEDITYDPTVPNRLYAATYANHIVVSTDNGANWDLLYSMLSTDYISDLKLTPGNSALSFGTRDAIHILNLASNTITASFPIPQSGVAGAGLSWLNSYDLYDAAGTTMVVDTGFSIGFASFGKTFYTKDSGNTWIEVYYTLNNNNVFINDVAISPTNSDKIFLARGNGDSDIDGGLWTSTNTGTNWTEVLEGVTLDAIAFNPANANDMMIGSSIGFGIHPENLYRSSDNGVTWSVIPLTFSEGILNNITKIVYNPANPQQIVALEENEIIRTNNGGTDWESLAYPVGISMEYYYGINASYNPSDGNQIAISTDLYPQMLNNTSEALTQILAPFFYITRPCVAKYSGNVHLYYGGQGGRHHKNITTGVTSSYDTEAPDSYNPKRNYMFADPVVPGRVFTYAAMGFFGGWVTMSTDYGATTTNILQIFGDEMQELTIDPSNNNIIYVAIRSGDNSIILKIDVTDINNIVTTDIVTPEVSEFGEDMITGIIIDAADSNIMYISKRHKVFKTVDGGLNWDAIGNGLEAITSADIIWHMAKNALNTAQFTLGTNFGIFTSMDSGENWSAILDNADVRRITHSPLNDGVLIGSIYTSESAMASIAYSINNGTTWDYVMPEDLHYSQVYGMDYDFEGNSINAYIGTPDLGVFRYTIGLALATDHPVANNPIGIYPNPATDKITVFIANGEKINTVQIFSLTGQKVLESASDKLDVTGLSTGIYVAKVTTKSGKSFSQKLIRK